MADYISRESVKKMFGTRYGGFQLELDAIPAADVVEVVYCKDCKYGDYDSEPDGAMVCLRTHDGFWRKEVDFCSYGKPKE